MNCAVDHQQALLSELQLGAVYGLPSGKYVQLVEPASQGIRVHALCLRDLKPLPSSEMYLMVGFVWRYGRLAWSAADWVARIAARAAEEEAVRLLRERRELAAAQDIARAKEIDRAYLAQQLAARKDVRETLKLGLQPAHALFTA
jgi:hypothetical protein